MNHQGFIHHLDKSAIFTVIGIIFLFSFAVGITLIAPSYVDPTWTEPTSPYQVQMYEVSDPHLYISRSFSGGGNLQYVYHIKNNYTLLAFQESDTQKIIAPAHLEKFVNRLADKKLKLTSRLLFLRQPQDSPDFKAKEKAEEYQKILWAEWEKENPHWKEEGLSKIYYNILEIYDPELEEGFALAPPEILVENWIENAFIILDESIKQPYHKDYGVIFVKNPMEYKVRSYLFADEERWRYDQNGKPIKDLQELISLPLGFRSRADLITLGEHIFAVQGCWYCHTDQTRTLVQDTVLNGSDSFPAPPSSANEYIYQKITFPGTRRIGPDLSRVGIKRPNRDWHKSHFWAPKTASKGSIMPAFQHFFDNDPRGTRKGETGVPNVKFEAIYQYLMTKGTRITPPTQAWWLGKDPINTIEIIEGQKRLK